MKCPACKSELCAACHYCHNQECKYYLECGYEMDRGQYREHVSYAIGDPMGEFSYIPHIAFQDGSVWLPKESVKMLWEWHHADWFAERFRRKHHGQAF